MLNLVNIIARDLSDAFFQAVSAIVKYGRNYKIDRGSYEGQFRRELDFVTIHITHPGTRPLVPELPSRMAGVPPVATMEYVEEYLPYLLTDQKLCENELYTYGERIAIQLESVVSMLKRSKGTNQATIAVARPEDIFLEDPPCLRQIDCRVFPKASLENGESQSLHFFPTFRSNDFWNGFPVNLAAIRLMQ